jgi:hypothetical protein
MGRVVIANQPAIKGKKGETGCTASRRRGNSPRRRIVPKQRPARLERLIRTRKDGIMQITNFKALYIAELQEMSLERRRGEPSVERGDRVVWSCR